MQYIPEISDNLFSVGAVDAKDVSVTFRNGKVNLIYTDRIVVSGQKESANLYRLNGPAHVDREQMLHELKKL